jgi:hypothetical protein
VSAAAFVSPADLANLDGRTFLAFEQAVADRWTMLEELLACLVELAHAQLIATLAPGRPRGAPPLPEPLHIPRPGEQRKREPLRLSASAFALGQQGKVVRE